MTYKLRLAAENALHTFSHLARTKYIQRNQPAKLRDIETARILLKEALNDPSIPCIPDVSEDELLRLRRYERYAKDRIHVLEQALVSAIAKPNGKADETT